MFVYVINVVGWFCVFGGKIIIVLVMCLGLFDVCDLKLKYYLCDVFYNFCLCESVGCVFIKM